MKIKSIFERFQRKPPKTYGISAKFQLRYATPIHKGAMPTINQSSIEKPSIYIAPCMVLTVTNENDKYIEFRVSANSCGQDSEKARNGAIVWYKKELFNRLMKKDLQNLLNHKKESK